MAQGDVLAWTGSCGSRTTLRSILQIEYSEDGDFLGSEFSRATGIGYHSEGMREAEMVAPSDQIEELLGPFSYSETFLPELIRKVGRTTATSDTVVLFYDARNVRDSYPDFAKPGVILRWLGRATYTF